MDRIKIKEKAKQIISGKLLIIWKPMIIIFLCQILLQIVFSIFGININESSIELFGNISINPINSIFSLILSPLYVGYTLYILKIIRKKKYDATEIFDQYKNFTAILFVNIIIFVLTIIGYAFLIIPGIIISLALSMSSYLLADKSKDIISTLKRSNEMMDGYKTDYLIFHLSFIGWYLLCAITLGIAIAYVMPYVSVANALYYEDLKKKN